VVLDWWLGELSLYKNVILVLLKSTRRYGTGLWWRFFEWLELLECFLSTLLDMALLHLVLHKLLELIDELWRIVDLL